MSSFHKVFLVLSLVRCAESSDASPIGKVLEMLSDLQGKILSEGNNAQKVYSEFTEWCEDTSKDLDFQIKTSKSDIDELKASIEKDTSTILSMNSKVDELSSHIATDEADLTAATKIRDAEASDFGAEHKELAETIDILERAIAILEREAAKGGASMLQLHNAKSLTDAFKIMVQASVVSSADAEKLTALVQSSHEDSDDDTNFGAPAAAIYDSHSGGIVDTLQNLLEKAQTQLDAAQRKETDALHNFDMLKQSIQDEIKFETKDMSESKQTLASSSGSKSTAEGDLTATSKDLSADQQALGDLHHECMTKSQDFEAETKSRGEELKALAAAKRILSETAGGADKIAYGFIQVSSQMTSRTDLANYEALRMIRSLAKKHNSAALSQLAARMMSVMSSSRAGQDPFAKVKSLISDMITRLEEEAGADASEKAYCDKELAESTEKKDDRQATVSKLSTKIDQMSAKSAQLKEEVASLQRALSSLTRGQAEMTAIRSEEKSLFTTSKADTEKGLDGVKLALKVLRDYYSKDDKAHTAAEGAGAGIIGLLEVCEADFSKSLAETQAGEAAAASAFDRETKENQIEKVTKEQDSKYKTQEFKGLDKAIAESSSDRKAVQEELDAILEYLSQLKKRCIAKPETYSERRGRREAEIAGLKDALEILENETALIQNGKRSLRKSKL